MSHSKGKKQRPLGSLRHTSALNDEKLHIPRLVSSSSTEGKHEGKTEKNIKLDKHYKGIQGNAMTVPINSTSREQSKETTPETSSVTTLVKETIKVQENTDKKELKEALTREKNLKQQVSSLEKLIEELRGEVKDKEQIIVEMDEKMKLQTKEHDSALECEVIQRRETQSALDTAIQEVEKNKSLIIVLKEDHTHELEKLKNEIERLKEVIKTKDSDIAVRDQKLGRLKLQMADALKGNSWERQQQLEELTKELARLQDESDMLKIKLKSYSRNKQQGQCSNCDEMKNSMEKINAALKSKDQIINELNSLVTRYETQLTKQEKMLKLWADSKGYKV